MLSNDTTFETVARVHKFGEYVVPLARLSTPQINSLLKTSVGYLNREVLQAELRRRGVFV